MPKVLVLIRRHYRQVVNRHSIDAAINNTERHSKRHNRLLRLTRNPVSKAADPRDPILRTHLQCPKRLHRESSLFHSDKAILQAHVMNLRADGLSPGRQLRADPKIYPHIGLKPRNCQQQRPPKSHYWKLTCTGFEGFWPALTTMSTLPQPPRLAGNGIWISIARSGPGPITIGPLTGF